jgi:adenylate cyclase class 1
MAERVDALDIRSIHRNKKFFQHYNRLRQQCAYDLNAEKASVAFEIIPVLLTLNEVDLPGYVSGGESGCGVYGVGSSYHLRKVLNDYFPETKKRNIPYQRYLIKRPVVESLFVLGSIGTVGQTERSDFDFWVCVDGDRLADRSIQTLEEKTDLITHWCQSTFNMHVHFFVLDLRKIRMNDFGKVDEESAGSSQKKFLKEEFYRTMLLVSGKIPFWWVLPSGITESDYTRHWTWMIREAPLDFLDFIDLGYLSHVSRDEFMGNALWQLSKGIKDPFKALLKMALMEVYLSDDFKGRLLCDVLKEDVLAGCRSLRDMDPYLLMVETIFDFYKRQERLNYRDLMRRAFYLKAEPNITRTKVKTRGGDYKVEVFKELMEAWNWSLDLVEDLNQVENWSYGRQLHFSREINRFFFSTYRRLSESFFSTEKQAIDDEDLTILGRRLFSLFARRRNKIKLTPFLTRKRLILGRCIFQYENNRSGKKRWIIYDASWYSTERDEKRRKIFSSEGIVRATAWLVTNGLYDFHRTIVEMVPNSSGVTIIDLEHLLRHLEAFFQPAFYESSSREILNQEVAKDRVMAMIDMEEVSKLKKPTIMDLVYKNTWGEVFTETVDYRSGLIMLKKFARDLHVSEAKEVPSRIKVHLPDSLRGSDLATDIYLQIYRELGLEDGFEEGRFAFSCP